MIDSLFEILDVTHDGAISRSDLHLAAKHMGWHWDSVLIPPCNGFREWVEGCIESGKNTLVIGGCTLYCCVRVSSIETLRYFKRKNLRIVVDLSICGARTRNFLPSPLYNGLSAVESAVHQMAAAGVQVVRREEWKNNDKASPAAIDFDVYRPRKPKARFFPHLTNSRDPEQMIISLTRITMPKPSVGLYWMKPVGA